MSVCMCVSVCVPVSVRFPGVFRNLKLDKDDVSGFITCPNSIVTLKNFVLSNSKKSSFIRSLVKLFPTIEINRESAFVKPVLFCSFLFVDGDNKSVYEVLL